MLLLMAESLQQQGLVSECHVNVNTDLQYEQNKEVSIGYPLELLKQILRQET